MSGILEVDLLERRVSKLEIQVDKIEGAAEKLSFLVFGDPANGLPGLAGHIKRLETMNWILLGLGALNASMMALIVYRLV